MILGIDGGGSKTEFLLCNTSGVIEQHITSSTLHYMQIGFDEVAKLLKHNIQKICNMQKNNKALQSVCIGIPGYGESSTASTKLAEIIKNILPSKYEIVNDVKLAWAGSLACKPGICILAGTGSMGYAVDEKNNDHRSGGWGHHFGDEGSAFWIGLQACHIFCKMSDGRYERGALYTIIKNTFSLMRDFDIIDIITQAHDYRYEVAQLSKLVFEAAHQGDRYAQLCIQEACKELSLLVKSILNQAYFSQNKYIALSYNGGLFNNGEYFFTMLKNTLTQSLACPMKIQKPILSPVQGACLYAAIQHGISTTDFLQNIRNNI